MASFKEIVSDIKNLDIQGATNIAKSAVLCLALFAEENRRLKKVDFSHHINSLRKILFQSRQTEPAMRNAVNYVLSDIEIEQDPVSAIKKRAKEVEYHFENSNRLIAKYGSMKIKNGMVVFTHCHSSSVTAILKLAKHNRTRFEVHNTETRPMLQGRITARELSREGIPVVHYVDSAGRLALKKADLMLIGADAVTTEGKVINKIGSEMFAEIANKYDIPVYSCTDSWKFDPETIFGYEEEIEQRTGKEVWTNPPKGVKIDNHAFEKINPELISGIISELGVYKPAVFVDQIRRAYPWIY